MHDTAHHHRHILPGLGHRSLTPFYDVVTRLLGVGRLHRRLLATARLPADARVLEIGCGTGNLALRAARRHPATQVVGIDPDEAALARAHRKSERRGLDVRWDAGVAQDLPYEDGSFDRVLSSLMLHHLDSDDRVAALREVRRVLTDDGVLHLMDLGGDGAPSGVVARRLATSRRFQDHHEGGLRRMLVDAGFTDVEEVATPTSRLLGPITVYRASR